MRYSLFFILLIGWVGIDSCKKSDGGGTSTDPLFLDGLQVDGSNSGFDYSNVTVSPVLSLNFSAPVDRSTISSGIVWKQDNGSSVTFNTTFANDDKTVTVQPAATLQSLTAYTVQLQKTIASTGGRNLQTAVTITLKTRLDSTDKFPVISDEELLTLVEKQTFKYFWDFGHPVSGLARERNTSGETVTTGGSGFGIMALIAGIERQFITRAQGLQRMQQIVAFLKNKAATFHGAFPHWLNGTTGAVQPFSTKDDGADLVETSFLMEGLLSARQYFDDAGTDETTLRNDINALWEAVEWSWFRKDGGNVLYWHWSPNYNWEMNHPIQGWNECLVTYVLAAASPAYTIPKEVYDQGWAGSGSMQNGNAYYGTQLPLGPSYGGPLFFAHYSFLGIDPHDLSDAYANYWTQNVAHSLINYTYCKNNPNGFDGYSNLCWGLTASDDNISGYAAHSPTNDLGVISPTAAVSSIPYTPQQSMDALRFFYYKLGDQLWGDYGFKDAFNLSDGWFADSYLAIDQAPQVVMIENYRSSLLWNLFMSCPEVKAGLTKLGFQGPGL